MDTKEEICLFCDFLLIRIILYSFDVVFTVVLGKAKKEIQKLVTKTSISSNPTKQKKKQTDFGTSPYIYNIYSISISAIFCQNNLTRNRTTIYILHRIDYAMDAGMSEG